MTPCESWPARLAPTSASPISAARSGGAPAAVKIFSVTRRSCSAERSAIDVLPCGAPELATLAGRTQGHGNKGSQLRPCAVAELLAAQQPGPAPGHPRGIAQKQRERWPP